MNTTLHAHDILDSNQVPSSRELQGMERIAEGTHLILQGLEIAFGLDTTNPNFDGTPVRVAKAYRQIFGGLDRTEERIKKLLATSFPCEGDEMVLIRGIRVFSMCPHHLLPVAYHVDVAYIPSQDGKVLGLSKLGRLVELLARRPVLQEQFTGDVTSALMTIPGCQGAACLVEGQHYCMIMRGAGQPDAVTVTSSVKGVFSEEDSTRAEFLELIRRSGR